MSLLPRLHVLEAAVDAIKMQSDSMTESLVRVATIPRCRVINRILRLKSEIRETVDTISIASHHSKT